MRRRNTRNVSDDDVSFLEEADALHAFASTLGRVGRRRRRQGVASLDRVSLAAHRAVARRAPRRRRAVPVPGHRRRRFFGHVAPFVPRLGDHLLGAGTRGGARRFQKKQKMMLKKSKRRRRRRSGGRACQRATPFKLGVSAEEFLARSRVVLPFEHQGGYAYGPDPDVLHRAHPPRRATAATFCGTCPATPAGRAAWRAAATARRENRKSAGGGVIVCTRATRRTTGRGRNRTRTRSWTRTRTFNEELLSREERSSRIYKGIY